MLFEEVRVVVREDEDAVLDANRCLSRTGIVGVLQQFRQHESEALDLLKSSFQRAASSGLHSNCSHRLAAPARIVSKNGGGSIISAAPRARLTLGSRN